MPSKVKWEPAFKRFAKKYLQVGGLYDDNDHWTPNPGTVMFYHPDGELDDDQIYRRLVLCFHKTHIQVLKPDYVTSNLSVEDIYRENQSGDWPDYILSDDWYYAEYPTMFNEIIVFDNATTSTV